MSLPNDDIKFANDAENNRKNSEKAAVYVLVTQLELDKKLLADLKLDQVYASRKEGRAQIVTQDRSFDGRGDYEASVDAADEARDIQEAQSIKIKLDALYDDTMQKLIAHEVDYDADVESTNKTVRTELKERYRADQEVDDSAIEAFVDADMADGEEDFRQAMEVIGLPPQLQYVEQQHVEQQHVERMESVRAPLREAFASLSLDSSQVPSMQRAHCNTPARQREQLEKMHALFVSPPVSLEDSSAFPQRSSVSVANRQYVFVQRMSCVLTKYSRISNTMQSHAQALDNNGPSIFLNVRPEMRQCSRVKMQFEQQNSLFMTRDGANPFQKMDSMLQVVDRLMQESMRNSMQARPNRY